ncbi:hypothetical protein QFZ27_003323 [Inquilinus ginsengisoli]
MRCLIATVALAATVAAVSMPARAGTFLNGDASHAVRIDVIGIELPAAVR